MNQFDKLKNAISEFYSNHGALPDVKISSGFLDEYAHQVSDLSKEGVNVEVVQNLKGQESFIIDLPRDLYPALKTINDLKKEVDKLVAEGKGDWPVKYQPDDAMVYLDIRLCPIVPGKAPFDWFEHKPGYADAPVGEHVLVLVGEEDKYLKK